MANKGEEPYFIEKKEVEKGCLEGMAAGGRGEFGASGGDVFPWAGLAAGQGELLFPPPGMQGPLFLLDNWCCVSVLESSPFWPSGSTLNVVSFLPLHRMNRCP